VQLGSEGGKEGEDLLYRGKRYEQGELPRGGPEGPFNEVRVGDGGQARRLGDFKKDL